MGNNFKIIKLRSMYNKAEAKTGPVWAKKNDARVTTVGKFIRHTHIDELPQFINVLKGDMSIVGPRPERPLLTQEFYESNHNFPKRLRIKPGITGYSQVNGGYDMTPDTRCQDDEYYINHISTKLDMKIILKTIVGMFTDDGTR